MKTLQLAIILSIVPVTVFGQTDTKTGYTNVEYLISKLPEVKKIGDDLEKQKKQYDVAYQQKVKDFQEKLSNYQKTGAALPDIIKKDKEKELETMQASIQELQQNAEKDLANKQSQMVQPLYVKVYSAIQTVAVENGYQFIFNTGDSNQMRHLLVAPPNGDISDLVLKKMGTSKVEEIVAKKELPTEAKKDDKTKVATKTKQKAPAKTPVKKKK